MRTALGIARAFSLAGMLAVVSACGGSGSSSGSEPGGAGGVGPTGGTAGTESSGTGNSPSAGGAQPNPTGGTAGTGIAGEPSAGGGGNVAGGESSGGSGNVAGGQPVAGAAGGPGTSSAGAGGTVGASGAAGTTTSAGTAGTTPAGGGGSGGESISGVAGGGAGGGAGAPAAGFCESCASDAECMAGVGPGALCVNIGGSLACGIDCSTTACPDATTVCVPVRPGVYQCIPASDDCSCTAATDGATRPCSVTNEHGTCSGLSTCDASYGFGACSAPTPAEDTCDGVDNDCDGTADEDFPTLGAACDGVDSDQCANGTYTCTAAGDDVECVNETVEDIVETCNGEDDDCSGAPDEPFLDGTITFTDLDGTVDLVLGDSCGTGPCSGGEVVCSANGLSLDCSTASNASQETCDGTDEDCDGVADDPFLDGTVTYTDLDGTTGLSLTDACGVGVCAGGEVVCDAGGTALTCSTVGNASQDVCNGADDDCDGSADEGFPTLGEDCDGADSDDCMNGTYTCNAGGTDVECVNESVEDIVDVCNGLDDDCDGTPDDPFVDGTVTYTDLDGTSGLNLGDSCGLGVCSGGEVVCASGGTSLTCSTAGNLSLETCNGLDDDCNGTSDDPFRAGGTVTYTDLDGTTDLVLEDSCGVGACNGGQVVCAANMTELTCSTATNASQDTCNGADDDCDGATDEDFPTLTTACDGADSDHCTNGTYTCNAGGTDVECVNESVQNILDLCNGMDDDCDPLTADGADEATLGLPCDTGLDGICADGTLQCTGGPGLACVQNEPAVYEICGNGLDDNCNGEEDESIDEDGDGWGHCDGDCCDRPGTCSSTPDLVNPGAYEVVGNFVDDDCDPATSDESAPPPCSTAADFSVTPQNLAEAMDLCQFTTADPPLSERKWGVVSAQFRNANGTTPSSAQLNTMQNSQAAVLANYGNVIVPQSGPTMAGLSNGWMRDENDPNFPGTPSTSFGYNTTPPAAYLAAHAGSLPASAGCSGTCPAGSGANDSVNLRLTIRVPTNAQSFAYQFRFFSYEYWTYACSPYNDFYLALLTSGATGIPADKNISFDSLNNPVSVNNGFFEVCVPRSCYTCPNGTAELAGTGMELSNYGGGTVWLQTTAPVVPGETMTLELMVFDVSDTVLDSLALLDAFEWSIDAASVGTGPPG